VGVNTSPDFFNVTGKLSVVDLASKTIIHELELPGQPDAVDVSKENQDFPMYVAVAIENERDEDLGDGAPPQLPAGLLTIVTISSEEALADPTLWTSMDVTLTGLGDACRFPEDPEPEYVAIHPDNTKVVVTLQENNCNVIVELESGAILGAYDAGAVELEQIDTIEDGLISQVEGVTAISRESVGAILREPDGNSWIGTTDFFATANEGDLDGGSRGWSIVDASTGEVVYDSSSALEWETAKIGHYPDERSGNKGNEPENVFYANFPDFGTEYVFVLSERSSVVFVYSIDTSLSPLSPELVQILAVGNGPEGITVIPSQNLVAIASEVDGRGDKVRSSIAVFELGASDTGVPEYPTLVSAPRDSTTTNGPPIPFAALSGLAAASPYGSSEENNNILYTVEDSFYTKNRILTIDASSFPAVIISEQTIMDSNDVLSSCLEGIEGVINEDATVNIDPEGISMASGSGFWIVSEGKGNIGDEARPFETPNLLLKLDEAGTITECILPDDSFQPQLRYGFEGVAEDGPMVAVALQRAWGEETNPRLAVYDTTQGIWKHAFYPLDEPESQNGGWVGLSDIAPLGGGKFMVLERDNQAGHDAAIKKIYSVDLGDYSWEDGTLLTKTLVKDLIADGDLTQSNGQIIEKVEGLTVTSDGDIWINTDNDGVDDNSGESLLAKVGVYAGNNDSGSSGASEHFVVMVTIVSCLVPLLAIVAGF
jgi:hypothetical protein